jgi:preprotein translocase subunit SecD
MVSSPILEGQGIITGNFTEESAEDLAMFLKITPLPIPLKVRQEVNSNK